MSDPRPLVARLAIDAVGEPGTVLSWRTGAAGPCPAGELRLHWVPLDTGRGDGGLTDEELSRAAAFVQPRDSTRWAAARAALRRVLAGELGCEPAAVRLARAPGGKPMLADGGPAFNLSHSGGWAVIALGYEAALGVDLEVPDTLARPDWRRIATRCFAGSEASEITTVEEACGRARFLDHWLVKEALLKAEGSGLAAPLAEVASAPVVAAGAGWIDFRGRRWACRLLDLPGDFRGALAVARIEGDAKPCG